MVICIQEACEILDLISKAISIQNLKKYFKESNLFFAYFLLLNLFMYKKSNLDLSLFTYYLLCWTGILFNVQFNNSKKKNYIYFISIFLLILITVNSLNVTSIEDNFIYISILLSVFTINIFNNNNLNIFNNKKLVLLGSLQFINILLMPYLSIFFQVNTAKISNFLLNFIGINSIQKTFNIINNRNIIEVNTGCSGYIQLFFSLTSLLILYQIFPISKMKNYLYIVNYSIIFPILINSLRIFLLSIFIFSNSDAGKTLFDFFHAQYGSLIFSGFSVYFVCNKYIKIIESEKKVKL